MPRPDTPDRFPDAAARARRWSRRALASVLAVAAALVAFPPSEGAGDINATPEALAILRAAIAQLDCRVVLPADADPAPVPWCLRSPRAPRSADAAIEILAIRDGLARLRAAGFGDAIDGLAVIHFAASPVDEGFAPVLQRRFDKGRAAEIAHALAVARDVGHSYYLHEKGVIALRPQGWEDEVRRQVRVQYRGLKDVALDPVTFPVYVSLYHEFGHRLLDHDTGGIVHGSRAETAADLFAASMIARHYALDFTRVARAIAKARQIRAPLEDDMHRTANLLMAGLAGLEQGDAPPAPTFASIRRIVFALADGAIGTAEATIPEPAPELSCAAPPGFVYEADANPASAKVSSSR